MRKFKKHVVLHFLHINQTSKLRTSFCNNIIWDILTREYNTRSILMINNNSFLHTENTLQEFKWMYYYEKT